MKVEELSFFSLYQPGLQGLPENERLLAISDLLAAYPDLPDLLREEQDRREVERVALAAGEYESTPGYPDLYKYFCQRYRTLVRESGSLGVVLPRTAFVSKGSEGFRDWLYTRVSTAASRLLAEPRSLDV